MVSEAGGISALTGMYDSLVEMLTEGHSYIASTAWPVTSKPHW